MLIPLEKALDELSEESEEFAVIVEGKRDKESLYRLGIRRVFVINTFSGYEDLAETLYTLGVRRVVILTDFDRKGREIRKKLVPHLANWGIVEIYRLRKLIRDLTGVKEIEALYERVLEIEGGDFNGEDLRRFRKVRYSRKTRGKGHGRQARRHRSHIRSNGRPPR